MSLLTSVFNRLRRGQPDSPFQVIEMKEHAYADRLVRMREDCLVLYASVPNNAPSTANDQPNTPLPPVLYEVVLHKPIHAKDGWKAFSLVRVQEESAAENEFHLLKAKLPILMAGYPSLFTVRFLERIVELVHKHPSWSLAHLSADLDVPEAFTLPAVQAMINEQDEDAQCALHVAIKKQNLRSVEGIMACEPRLDIKDSKGSTVFHLAALSNERIIEGLARMDSPMVNASNDAGYTPLHMACMADKPDCVRALLIAGADVNSMAIRPPGDYKPVDIHEPETHEPREVIDLTAQRANNTPRSSPAPAPSPTPQLSAKDILANYPKQFDYTDMRYGGTPLHWVTHRPIMEAFIKLGCLLDARNFLGDTALHLMVQHDRLACAVTLMSHGCDVDAEDREGNTPLHLACTLGRISLVKALLAMGASLRSRNKEGMWPRHMAALAKPSAERNSVLYIMHAIGAPRCPTKYPTCNAGCSPDGDDHGVPLSRTGVHSAFQPDSFSDFLSSLANEVSIRRQKTQLEDEDRGAVKKKKKINCLSLDGGGVRGVILCQMLLALEEALGCPVVDCFDWMAGTSTGAYLALFLLNGKSVRECQRLYLQLKDEVLQGSRPYSSEKLEGFLRLHLGENSVMTDITRAKVIVTTSLVDRIPPELHLFRNYPSPEATMAEYVERKRLEDASWDFPFKFPQKNPLWTPPAPNQQLQWQAARASGAAPTYFRAFSRFLDGGLIANNPTMDLLTEIWRHNMVMGLVGRKEEQVQVSCVVSLGTGMKPVTEMSECADAFFPDSLSIFGAAKAVQSAQSLFKVLVEEMTNSDYHVCDRSRAWCGLTGTPFYRLNPNIDKTFPLDETRDDILVDAMWETMVYMHRNREEVKAVAFLLRDGPEAALCLPAGGAPPTAPPTRARSRSRQKSADDQPPVVVEDPMEVAEESVTGPAEQIALATAAAAAFSEEDAFRAAAPVTPPLQRHNQS